MWRPKTENKHILVDYSDDIGKGVFDFSHHGKTVCCPKKKKSNGDREDVILFDRDNNIKIDR